MPQQKKSSATKIKVNRINNDDYQLPSEDEYVEMNDENINYQEDDSQPPKSLNIYRKIAVSFIVLTGLLIAIIFYFSFVNVTIKIEPREERLSDSLNFDLHNSEERLDFSQKDIAGLVKKINLEHEDSFNATGEEVMGEEIVGEVTIINNNNKNQILVATTRLLTPDNKLFRIKKTINVPAGGSLSAEIYADNVSPEMAIAPSTFTIPGLWAGLQDKIYAKSDEGFIYRKKINRYIQKSDTELAATELKKELLEQASKELDINYDQVIYELDENSIEISMDAKVGDQTESFNAKAVANVVVIAYNSDKIVNLAKRKLESMVPDNKKLSDFNSENIIFNLNNYNVDKGIASISTNFEGLMILEDKQQIIDRNMIIGLNKDQLENHLSRIREIKSFQIHFSPSFINKVPKLTDRIKIE